MRYISVYTLCQCGHEKWRHRCVNNECDSCYISTYDRGCKAFKLSNLDYLEILACGQDKKELRRISLKKLEEDLKDFEELRT